MNLYLNVAFLQLVLFVAVHKAKDASVEIRDSRVSQRGCPLMCSLLVKSKMEMTQEIVKSPESFSRTSRA